MTNSIASAKCPSVLTSGKYGMSQHRSIVDDSKEYIFVKLTDSAFRAIEEYQRNAQSKRLQKGQCAKIQFIGNAGVIHFPTADGSNGPSDGRKFGFAIDDVEGSLECIQQSGADLDVLGSLNYRMRIHANDDVYDTTRTKMAIAEETEKSKCIREIKPNQTDIGRKVKRPISAASIQAYTNGTMTSLNGVSNGNGINGSNNSISSSINGSSSYLSNSSSNNNNSRNKLSATTLNNSPSGGCGGGNGGSGNGSRLLTNSSLRSSPNPSLMGGIGTVGNSVNTNNRYGSPSNLSSSSLPSLSSNLVNGITSVGGYSPPASGITNNHNSSSLPSLQPQKKSNGNSANSKSNGSVLGAKGSLGKTNSVSNGKNMDVSRRKIRERLIHLLALKPFKKPELYARLQNEGLAQRERQLISTILKDISTLSRDNTYNLRRSMWNDVDENWPFFSEQEIQQLKRRKPQNLTPPMSSDAGSSTSGQSPTSSTHTGSPPPLTGGGTINGGGVTAGGIKRTSLEPDLYDGALTLGMQSKKQRISHYKKDGSGNTNGSNLVGAGARMGVSGGVLGGGLYGGSSYNQNHRSSSAAYSPHNYNTVNNNGNDENSGNSDLSFNVLNNVDDFIQHTASSGDQNFAGHSKTTSSNKIACSFSGVSSSSNSGINNTTFSSSSLKEKRSSGGSNCSSGYGSNRESSSTSSSSMRRKNSPTPYANNFVPETKLSSNSNGSSSRYQQVQRHQQSSPNYNSNINNHHPHTPTNSSNSVIPSLHEDYSMISPSHTPINHSINTSSPQSSSRSRHHSSSSSGITNVHSGELSSSSKHSRSSTPTQKHSSKHNSSKNVSAVQENLINNNLLQQQQQFLCSDAQTPPQTTVSHSCQQSQQQEHSSPTQQIAAAASTFSLTNHCTSSGDAPRYDFSNYTPITSIEQRRKYKTEFESDYDEYRKLLAQIESVGHRFRELADRLSRVQQGCTDYYNIKDQIVSEYNRIRKEEAINRDKQRFDYLHEKLAHIKQLVMDYDKKLTSGLASPSPSQYQQQQHEQHNQQQNTVTNNSAHLSPMLQSSGESNHSPPLVVMNPTATVKNSLTSSHTKKSSKHRQKNQQQQHQQLLQQEHYQQHHEPETIQMNETLLQYHSYNGNHLNQKQQQPQQQEQQQQQEPQHNETPATVSHSSKRKQQHEHYQQLQSHNDSDSDSDSDSSSSSSSNSDNSDDDNSDASDDDDNSDNDSNDDDDNDDDQ